MWPLWSHRGFISTFLRVHGMLQVLMYSLIVCALSYGTWGSWRGLASALASPAHSHGPLTDLFLVPLMLWACMWTLALYWLLSALSLALLPLRCPMIRALCNGRFPRAVVQHVEAELDMELVEQDLDTVELLSVC